MVRECQKGRISGSFVHKFADVSPLAKLGNNVKIWRWTHIDDYAIISDGVMVAQCCYVAPGVVIGRNCRIQNNVSLFRGVVLEDNVFVGPSVVFTNVRQPKIFRKAEFGDILVKEGAVLGANCTIVAPCVIGKNSFVAAGAVVISDVPDNTMVAGVPAKVKKTITNDKYNYE